MPPKEAKKGFGGTGGKEVEDEGDDDKELDSIAASKKLLRVSKHDEFDLEVLAKASRARRLAARQQGVETEEQRCARAARGLEARERVIREVTEARELKAQLEDAKQRGLLDRRLAQDKYADERRAACALNAEAEREFRNVEQRLEERARQQAEDQAEDAAIEAEIEREMQRALQIAEEEERRGHRAEAAAERLRARDTTRGRSGASRERSASRLRKERRREVRSPPREETPPEETEAQRLAARRKKVEEAGHRELALAERRAAREARASQQQAEAARRKKRKEEKAQREVEERAKRGRERRRRDKIEHVVRGEMLRRLKEEREHAALTANAVKMAEDIAALAEHAATAASRSARQLANRANKARAAMEREFAAEASAAERLLAEETARDALAAEEDTRSLLAARRLAAARDGLRATLHYADTKDAALHVSLDFQIPETWAKRPARKLLESFSKGYSKSKGAALADHTDNLELETITGTSLRDCTVEEALNFSNGMIVVTKARAPLGVAQ